MLTRRTPMRRTRLKAVGIKGRQRKHCRICGNPCTRRAVVCWRHRRNGPPADPAKWPRCKDCGVRITSRLHLRCSSCAYTARKNRTRAPRPCPQCGHPFQPAPSVMLKGGGKFCSFACYRAWTHEREKALLVQCTQCGTEFRRKIVLLRRRKHSFCRPVCSQRFHRGTNAPNWRGGREPNRGRRWQRLAALIRERDDYACQRCGRSEEETGERLSVDHRIPWRYLPKRLANHPQNLVSLCRRCHSWKTAAEVRWIKGDMQSLQRYLRDVKELRCVHWLGGGYKMLKHDLEAIALSRIVKLTRAGRTAGPGGLPGARVKAMTHPRDPGGPKAQASAFACKAL